MIPYGRFVNRLFGIVMAIRIIPEYQHWDGEGGSRTARTSIFVRPGGAFHDAVPFRESAHMGHSDRKS